MTYAPTKVELALPASGQTPCSRLPRHRRWWLVLVVIAASLAGVELLASTASAAPCPGSALNIVAHEDDDLIFINPDIRNDIRSGRCVRTVFLTAGDAGNAYPDSIYRERAPQAAYAQMAGLPNNWTSTTDDGVPGRNILVETLVGAPRVSIAFLRIPDGFPSGQGSSTYQAQSLLKLWNGSISSVRTVDGAATYTRTELISALASMMADYRPSMVRTMDYVSPVTDADHSDHLMTAAFAKAADSLYTSVGHTLMSYQGYAVGNRPQNVFGSDLQAKQAALTAASAFDPGAADPWVANLALRRYVLDTVTRGPGGSNRAPIADAGPDQSVAAGSSVQLTGAGSSDADGDALTYAWTRTAGPAVTLSSATAVSPTFTAPAAGSSVTFSLVVRDGAVSSVADTVTVTVPAAGAANVARTLSATASASTQNSADGQTAAKAIDGSPLGYPSDSSREWVSNRGGVNEWLQVNWTNPVILDRVVLNDRPNLNDQITGGTLTFSNGASVSVGPLANDGAQTAVAFAPRTVTWVRLSVNSVRAGTSNVGLAELEAWGTPAAGSPTNRVPVASAGADQSAPAGSSVQLSGAGSSDPDGDALTYAWTQTSGPAVALSSATAVSPTFTAPAAGSSVTFSLVVRDATLSSSADTVTITVPTPPANRAPIADAGSDQSVAAGSSVQVTGAGSSDPDGDALTYAWTQTAGPAVALSSATAVSPTFAAPAAGSSVTLTLVVRDGTLASPGDNVTITVPAAGSANVARTPGATATASTQNTGDGQTAAKAIDGSPLGYPSDYSREWVTVRQGAGAWLQLNWVGAVNLDHVVLHDRPNAADQITSGTLTFSDGSSVALGELSNDGSAVSLPFAPRTVSWVRLSIDSVRAGTSNVGLAEFEAWGTAQ